MEKPDKKPERLVSLDALRGFDMFWIIGGAGFFIALLKYLHFPESWIEVAQTHMEHVPWEGFHFFDLIFPMFVFISGVSICYSIESQRKKGTSISGIQLRILKRVAILILLGLSFSFFRFVDGNTRLYTVLWLIAMSYGIAASFYLHFPSWKKQLICIGATLVCYHLALEFMPYPGKGDGIIPENNLAAWLDRNLIETNLYRKVYDPEGTIRVIPAGMLCLLGCLAGQRIRFHSRIQGTATIRSAAELAATGAVCWLLGWIWSFSLPVIKDLWTPSFILTAGAWSLLLLALFYLVIDVWKQRWIGWFFLPIGMNAITIYVAQRYFNFYHTRDFFAKGYANTIENPEAKMLLLTASLLGVQWLLLYFLYRKKIFIKV